jgi:hypothetical protein
MPDIGDIISTAVPTTSTPTNVGMQQILDLLTEFKTRLTKKLPTSALAPANSVLDMSGHAVINAGSLHLAEVEGTPAGNPLGRLQRFGGNLYWVDAHGTVQITSGPNLNAAALGGIIGDYGPDGRVVSYDDASEFYSFYDHQPLDEYAGLRAGNLRLHQDGGAGLYVQLQPADAPAVSYTMKLPEELPGAGSRALLAVTTSGEITHDADITAPTQFGAEVFHNADIVLNGAVKVRHGARVLLVPPVAATTTGAVVQTDFALELQAATTGRASIPIQGMVHGMRILSIRAVGTKGSTNALNFSLRPGLGPELGAFSTSVSGGFNVSHNLAAPYTVGGGGEDFLHVVVSRAVSGALDTLNQIQITYDVPA